MVLIVSQDCPFCTPSIISRISSLGGKILKVIQHPDGELFLTHNGKEFIPFSRKLPGIPALIDDKNVYIGATPILDFLEKTE